jgi:hypothetical protein
MLLLRVLGKSYLNRSSAGHRTTLHRNTKTNIHSSSGIGTHDPSNQAAKTYALDRTATGTGTIKTLINKYTRCYRKYNKKK